MHDPLNAIRRLYGAPGEGLPEEGASPEEGAELQAMGDLKAALDRLPPRRPDPSVIDAVVAAAGDAARPAALAPIRSVYGEGAAELDAPSELDAPAKAEARALAEMKAALEALPPQRPSASLVDAVVTAAGDAARAAALAPIRAVYEEAPEVLGSPAAEAEAAALTDLKAALDRLPPRRPDPAVIDAVVAAAARPAERPASVAAVTGRAADRAARPSRRDTRRRVAAVLGAVFAVVLVFGGGLWLSQDAPNPAEVAVADRAEADDQIAEAAPPTESQDGALPQSEAASQPEAASAAPPVEAEQLVVASRPQPTVTGRSASPTRRADPAVASDAAEAFTARAAAVSDDLSLAEGMALDADDELRLMYLRLREMQAGQAGLGWDTPPVSLGATPDSTPAASGWMQVRVQR